MPIQQSPKFFNFALILSLLALPSVCISFEYFQPLPPAPEYPADNQPMQIKQELGQKLFFDRRLSGRGGVSCNHCHDVMESGSDGKSSSIGDSGTSTRRSAPSLWNVAYQTVYFWDGRADSLENAIREHLLDPQIIGMRKSESLIARIGQIENYTAAFRSIFNADLSSAQVHKILADYVRTLYAPNSAFDRYMRGDLAALTSQQLRGKELFREVECVACHFGVNFSGPAPGPALKMGEGFY